MAFIEIVFWNPDEVIVMLQDLWDLDDLSATLKKFSFYLDSTSYISSLHMPEFFELSALLGLAWPTPILFKCHQYSALLRAHFVIPVIPSSGTIVISRALDHWKVTMSEEWKQQPDFEPGPLFLPSDLLTRSMAYDTTISYMFAMVAFGAALLSVTPRVAVHAMYDTSVTHMDMDTQISQAALLALCVCRSTFKHFTIMTTANCVAFFFNGVLTLYVLSVLRT
ncbi:hypothetical protein EDB19DRAFT_1824428 [Suillus lakei]|nr:hypothetical protein EDB19DRAFT_1824428 [Suillus lakei]